MSLYYIYVVIYPKDYSLTDFYFIDIIAKLLHQMNNIKVVKIWLEIVIFSYFVIIQLRYFHMGGHNGNMECKCNWK